MSLPDDKASLVVPSGNNLSNRDWLLGSTTTTKAIEDDAILSLALDSSPGSDPGNLFAGNFVPPPPRPLFLDEGATPDGLTTCDLCSWAWQNGNSYAIDGNLKAPGELGWVLTLVIVSLISAAVGAIVMIIVLHCRRLKSAHLSGDDPLNRPPLPNTRPSNHRHRHRPPISPPNDDKTTINTISRPDFPSSHSLPHHHHHHHNANNMATNGVWSWLSRRSPTAPTQLDNHPSSLVENHYTHMEEQPYNSVPINTTTITTATPDDALYAELDSNADRTSTSSTGSSQSPAYQNSAYVDPDAPTSSAPSSAYYSDLSVTTTTCCHGDRAYEVVGLVTMPSAMSPPPPPPPPVWSDPNNHNPTSDGAVVKRCIGGNGPLQVVNRLAAISENVSTIPSDYV